MSNGEEDAQRKAVVAIEDVAADKIATATVKAAEVLATAKLTAEGRTVNREKQESINLFNVHEAILVSAASTSELAEAIAATAQSSRRVQTWWLVCLTLVIFLMSIVVVTNGTAVRSIGDCITPGGECYERLEVQRREANQPPTGTTIPTR